MQIANYNYTVNVLKQQLQPVTHVSLLGKIRPVRIQSPPEHSTHKGWVESWNEMAMSKLMLSGKCWLLPLSLSSFTVIWKKLADFRFKVVSEWFEISHMPYSRLKKCHCVSDLHSQFSIVNNMSHNRNLRFRDITLEMTSSHWSKRTALEFGIKIHVADWSQDRRHRLAAVLLEIGVLVKIRGHLWRLACSFHPLRSLQELQVGLGTRWQKPQNIVALGRSGWMAKTWWLQLNEPNQTKLPNQKKTNQVLISKLELVLDTLDSWSPTSTPTKNFIKGGWADELKGKIKTNFQLQTNFNLPMVTGMVGRVGH